MDERFVVVYEEGEKYHRDTKFQYFENTQSTIECITELSNRSGLQAPAEVKRVFKFDEYGHVTRYEMKLNGFKLVLEAIPEKS